MKILVRIENGALEQLMRDLRDALIAARVPLMTYQGKLYSSCLLASNPPQLMLGERMTPKLLAPIIDGVIELEERSPTGEWVPGHLSKVELKMFMAAAVQGGWIPDE